MTCSYGRNADVSHFASLRTPLSLQTIPTASIERPVLGLGPHIRSDPTTPRRLEQTPSQRMRVGTAPSVAVALANQRRSSSSPLEATRVDGVGETAPRLASQRRERLRV